MDSGHRAPTAPSPRAPRHARRASCAAASALALAAAVALVLPPPARAEDMAAGARLYGRYCASCHGTAGRGDGPIAAALSPPPTDLTTLDEDVATLMQQIDGRRTIRAHGPAEMPVWGEVFEQKLIGEPHRRRTALLEVREIAEYAHGLQSRAGAAATPRP